MVVLRPATRIALVAVLSFALLSVTSHARPPTARDAVFDSITLTPAVAARTLAKAAVPFVPNAGQWDARAAFGARTLAGMLYVTGDGQLVYQLPASRTAGTQGRGQHGQGSSSPSTTGWSIVESFVDAEGLVLPAKPKGHEPAVAKVSYFTGDPRAHRSGIGAYGRVGLGEVFPGIDVQLRAAGNNVEKIFTVAPRRDPRQIRIGIAGATRLEIGAAGELVAHTGNGPVVYTAPVAYQDGAGGKRTPVDVSYVLESTGPLAAVDASHLGYRFATGPYDRAQPLVIDPLLQSTYLGGDGADNANAIAVHPVSGEIYVTGNTGSTSGFPKIAGGPDTDSQGTNEAFVSRLAPDLTVVLQSTYIGGPGDDGASSIAIHPVSGDVYIAGSTASTSFFPGAAGGARPTHAGGATDGFVTRLNAALTTLYQSTFLGGTGDDSIGAIAIHPSTGQVIVGGSTTSPTFPGTSGVLDTPFGGIDGFVTRLNPTLTVIGRSIYLGDTGDDVVNAIAINAATGEVYAAGTTSSGIFPGTQGGTAQSAYGGNYDAFVTRLGFDLGGFYGSTYIGGSGSDFANAMAINQATGDIYIAGQTNSPAASFPVAPTFGIQPTLGGGTDAFVATVSSLLKAPIRWTYLGGTQNDRAGALAIAPATGEIYVTGWTRSSGFPAVTAGVQSVIAPAGVADAFVTRLSGDLSRALQSTYLGADGDDFGTGIAVHPGHGDIYVTGYTAPGASAFPGVAGGAQSARGGGATEGFVSRLSSDLTLANTIPNRFGFIAQSNVPPGTLRTSNEVRVSGLPAFLGTLSVYTIGQAGSQLCVSNTQGCCALPNPVIAACQNPGNQKFTSGWVSYNVQILNSDYVQVRHTSPPSGTGITNLIVGGVATQFRTSTGNAAVDCNLDMNGDNKLDALTEGLVLLRAMFGLSPTAITQNTTVTTPWATLKQQINAGCGTSF